MRIVINWKFSDIHQSLASTLQHGALTSINGKTDPTAATTVTTTRSVFENLILGENSHPATQYSMATLSQVEMPVRSSPFVSPCRVPHRTAHRRASE